METFPALLALCAGNSPVTGEFPAQRPVTRSFDVFFDLCLNKRLHSCNARKIKLEWRSYKTGTLKSTILLTTICENIFMHNHVKQKWWMGCKAFIHNFSKEKRIALTKASTQTWWNEFIFDVVMRLNMSSKKKAKDYSNCQKWYPVYDKKVEFNFSSQTKKVC